LAVTSFVPGHKTYTRAQDYKPAPQNLSHNT